MLNEACGKEAKKNSPKEQAKKREEKEGEGEGEEDAPPSSSSPVRLGIGAAPLLAFERWMWACSASAVAAASASAGGSGDQGAAALSDPVVPRPSAANGSFEPGLVSSLVRAGADPVASEAVAALLLAESRRLSAAIAKEARARATKGSGKGEEKEAEVVSVAVHKHSLDLCAASSSPSSSNPSSAASSSSPSSKEFIKISRPAYCRLLRAFRECGPEAERPPKLEDDDGDDDDAEVAAAATSSSSSPSSRSAFHSRLFAMLLRYKSMAGPGFHASVGGPVCSVLAKTIGTGLEGFASPVNARWSRFGCAFADVDAVFGGLGSFFDEKSGGGDSLSLSANKLLLPVGGSVLVNPPFEPGLLLSAAQCCVKAVEEASKKGTRLSVVFVGPRWNGSGSSEREGGEDGGGGDSTKGTFVSALSSSSPFSCLEHHFTVAAVEHGYRDGAPHAARDPFRRSPFDSGVFLLRSKAEREKRPLKDLRKWEKEVREAFKLCLPSAEAAERQRTARGVTDRKGWGAASGGEGEGEGKKKQAPSSSLRASIEARQRLKAERRRGGTSASHSALSPSGKKWVKKSKMNSGGGGGGAAGKRKEGGGGGGEK